MSQTEVKYFTPNEARKTLPLVRQIVKDIITCGEEVRGLITAFGEHADQLPEAKFLMDKINGFIGELEEIGCQYKDWNFSIGLVDFPSVIEDREVMLCWKSDEPDVLFYHGIEEGFRGRKPIPEIYL